MKYLKKIFLCLMLVSVSLFSFACSSVKLSTTLYQNGKISTSFEVRLDDVSDSRSTIYALFKEYYQQLDKKYEDNLIYYFSFVYDSDAFASSDRATKLDFIIRHNTQFLAGDTSDESLKGVDNYKYFYLTKDFASIYAYLMYFCPSAFSYNSKTNKIVISSDYHSLVDVPMPSMDKDVVEDGNIFVKSYIQDFCPFYYDNQEPIFFYEKNVGSIHINTGDKLADIIKNCCGLTDDQVEYYFNFSTPYKRLHSSGEVKSTSQGYTHSWTLGSMDAKVEVWRNYANYVPWYVVSIIVGALTIFVATILIKTKNKKKTQKGLELLQKINELEQSKK